VTANVADARARIAQQAASMGVPADEASGLCRGLNAAVLTLRFARRFAAYKRPNLLLHDPARLPRILTNAERPCSSSSRARRIPPTASGRS